MKPKSHFLTFVVEDYFHSSALSSLISSRRWQRFETRIQPNTQSLLDLLDEYDTKATFFVLGWVADKFPSLVAEIAARGHEVASKGYSRRRLADMTPEEFRYDVRLSKDAIEFAAERDVIGFRLGCGSLQPRDSWVLDILAEEGFRYDSSVYPQFRSIANQPWRRFPYLHRHGDREILEFPLSTFGRDAWLLRAAGGNYARQFPGVWAKHAFRFWNEHYISPFNMYFHIWEFDPDAPRISGTTLISRIRQYRNLAKVPALLRYFLANYRFSPIACSLGVDPAAKGHSRIHGAEAASKRPLLPTLVPPATCCPAARTPITIVIPCYNEQPVLHYLAKTLTELDDTLGSTYDISFVFVDDGSTDDTANELQRTFASSARYRIIRHAKNEGVAAATLTGIRSAETEIVCAIDADCTYDPNQLQSLLSLLTDSVDVVTASPYHPLGEVVNVPRWRLFLSRGASHLYRQVLRNKLHTYTSCFRVYRKSAVADLALSDGRFLGITEILWQLDKRGSKIVECPAVLEVRVLGASKLKTLHGIAAHLKLLARIARQRIGSQPEVPRVSLSQTPDDHPHEVHHDNIHHHSTGTHVTI